MTVVIGLTGPIGCGKSTVARWLGELGAAVVDADRVAHEVTSPGEPALEAVIDRFGPDLRREDGTLDRAALGRLVFADPTALRDLEAIVHPAVRPRILSVIDGVRADGRAAVVVEAIKLVEGGLAALCDEVWLVSCDATTQRARLEDRGTTVADAARRIDAQGDIHKRLAPHATRILDTSGSPEEARTAVEAAYRSALASAGG
jgi:dephospho-CoA kinase